MSCARPLVKPIRPSLAATTCARCFAPVWALMPPMLTIAPEPLAFRCGSAAFTVRKAPSRMTEWTARQSDKESDSKGFSGRMAALLTRTSRRPNRSTAAATPASASASAIARPMLRPAPVTTATRPASSLLMARSPLPSEDRQVDGTVPQSARQREGRRDAAVGPAAGARVAAELLFQLGPGERLAGAAAQVRLALLEEIAAGEPGAQVSGVLERIRVGRIDLVAHLRRQGPDRGIRHRRVRERIEPEVPADQPRGDAVRRRELRGVSVRRPLLVRERLPQPVHGALR